MILMSIKFACDQPLNIKGCRKKKRSNQFGCLVSKSLKCSDKCRLIENRKNSGSENIFYFSATAEIDAGSIYHSSTRSHWGQIKL